MSYNCQNRGNMLFYPFFYESGCDIPRFVGITPVMPLFTHYFFYIIIVVNLEFQKRKQVTDPST